MAQENELNQAIVLIKAGNTGEAVAILKKILKANRNDESAWLWLSTCADTPDDKKFCFQQALRINPKNEQAEKALAELSQQSIPQKENKKIRNPRKKGSRKLIISTIFLFFLLISGSVYYFFYGPCGVSRVNNSIIKGKAISQRWDDENRVASQTAQIALSGPIFELQKIKRDMADMGVPACMLNWKSEIISYMDDVITGYLVYMKDQSTPKPFFDAAKIHSDTANQMWDSINNCSPLCSVGE